MTTAAPTFTKPYGLYESYDYYPNNFTFDDHPPGVWWKYLWFMGPGVAILHNSLPERTDHNDLFNLYVVICSCLIAVVDLFVEGLCIKTVWKSKTLSTSVKWFLLADAVMRFQNNLLTFFTMQCTLNWSCVDPTNYPFSWLFINQIWSALSAGQFYLVDLWALGLSVNRIFAIFFNGLHYHKVEKFSAPYIGLVFFSVEGLYLCQVGIMRSTVTGTYYYTGYIFMPNIYSFFIYLWRFDEVHNVVHNLVYPGYAVVATSIMLDALTFWRIRKMKKLSSNTKSRADFKLAIMVITTHFFNVALILYYQMNSLFFDSIDPLTSYLVYLPATVFPIITGATITAFNYPFKEKNKKTRVFDQANQVAASHNRGNTETQAREVD